MGNGPKSRFSPPFFSQTLVPNLLATEPNALLARGGQRQEAQEVQPWKMATGITLLIPLLGFVIFMTSLFCGFGLEYSIVWKQKLKIPKNGCAPRGSRAAHAHFWYFPDFSEFVRLDFFPHHTV